MLSSLGEKLFVVYLPPPSERGIDNLLFTVNIVFWFLWIFFIVHNVTLILIILFRQSCFPHFTNGGLRHRG